MAINFTDGVLLTAEMLNTAFSSQLDLTQTAPQQMAGNLSVPQLAASIALTTEDLLATGDVILSGGGALQLPGGSTLQRPNTSKFGMVRWNSDSGALEVNLPSGLWANVVTSAATQTPASLPANMGAPAFGQASSTAIPLAWVAPISGSPPFSYTIQYRPSGTTNFITWTTNLLTTTTTVSGLLPATRYDFNVTAYNAAGNAVSPASSTNTLGYLSGGPSNVSVFAPTSTTVSVSWSPVSSSVPVSYKLNYAAVGQSTWSIFGSAVTTTSGTITGLLPNTTYFFQVVALTTGGSYESNVVQATTAATATIAPNAPSIPTLTNLTYSSVNAAWNAPTIGSAPFVYNVQLQVGSGPWITDVFQQTTALSMTLTQLTSGQPFNVRVQATNSAGSAISSAVQVIPTTAVAGVGGVAGFQLSGYTAAPYLHGPQTGLVYTNGTLDVVGCGVTDATAAYLPGTMALTVICGAGTVTMTDTRGNLLVGSGSNGIIQLPLTYTSAQSVLASLAYTAPSTPTNDTVSITITDQIAATSSISINVSVIAPTGTVTPSPTPSSPPTPGSSTLRTSTGQPTDAFGVPASKMIFPLFNFGVGISPEVTSYGGLSGNNAAAMENAINYIGNGNLNFVRCNVSANLTIQAEQQFLAQVAQNCGSLTYFMTLDVDQLSRFTWQNTLTAITLFASNYGYVGGIGGIQNAGGPFGTNTTNVSAAQAFQVNVKTTAQTLNQATFASTTYYNVATSSSNFNPYSDYGYAYSFNGSSPNTAIASPPAPVHTYDLVQAVTLSQQQARQALGATTEFGWNSFPDNGAPVAAFNYVSQTAQASYLLTYLFSNFASSSDMIGNDALTTSSGSCIWADLYNNTSSYYGGKLGLFDAPGGSPTVAAQALRFTFQLLYDSNITAFGFETGVLDYTLTPAVSSLRTGFHQLLFQKADGTFVIVLWNEVVLNNSSTNAFLTVPPLSATVKFNFGAMASVAYYNPLINNSGSGPQPVQAWNNVANITVPVPANPVYILVNHG